MEEIRWKSDRQKEKERITRIQEKIKKEKQKMKPEKLSRKQLEQWMRENQTI